MKLIDIVIVNWNAGQQLQDCIKSILKCDKFDQYINNIIVVDNNSSDGSMDLIETLTSDLIKPVYNIKNEGFAKACNIGAALSSPQSDYILFLNPDTVLFPDTILKTVECIENSYEDIGIFGIRLLDETGQLTTTCSRFPSLSNYALKAFGLENLFPFFRKWGVHMVDFDHLSDREVDQVMGAFYIINKDLFTQLHGFDEKFFVYYEEVDLAYRALMAGYKTMFFAKPQAVHIGCGTTDQVKDKRLYYNNLARILYYKKHFNIFIFLSMLCISLTVEPATRIIWSLLKKDLSGVKNIYKGYMLLYKQLSTKGFTFS